MLGTFCEFLAVKCFLKNFWNLNGLTLGVEIISNSNLLFEVNVNYLNNRYSRFDRENPCKAVGTLQSVVLSWTKAYSMNCKNTAAANRWLGRVEKHVTKVSQKLKKTEEYQKRRKMQMNLISFHETTFYYWHFSRS